MTFRIFATCDIGREALQRLRDERWSLEVWPHPEPPPHEELLQRVRSGVDALVTTLRDRLDEAVFAAGAGTLRIVAQDAVGFDNIDRQAANRYRIPFSNTADVLTEATAEFAFVLMAAAARLLAPAEQMLREGAWSTWHPYLPWLGHEVTGRTVAVIGLGRIGRAFIKKAVGFDMDVLVCQSGPRGEGFLAGVRRVMEVRHAEGLCARQQTVESVSLEEALRRADFVSLHVNLTRPGESATPTWHLIDEARLRLLKPTAFLVNTSRGPVVDEQALAAALLEGRLAGAALDVYEQEPLPADSPLRDPRLAGKLRLLPHFASAAQATRLSPDPEVGMAGRTVQAVIDVLGGRYGGDPARMPYVVNKEAFARP